MCALGGIFSCVYGAVEGVHIRGCAHARTHGLALLLYVQQVYCGRIQIVRHARTVLRKGIEEIRVRTHIAFFLPKWTEIISVVDL